MGFLTSRNPDLRYFSARTAGLQAETCSRSNTATAAPVAGTYYFHRITLGTGAYTTASMYIPATAGVTLANSFVALHDVNTLARLAVSADQSTNWQTAGVRTTTLSFAASAGDYYLGLVIGSGATIPLFLNTGVSSAVAVLAPDTCGKHNTTGLTAAPDPLVKAAAAAFIHFWMRYE